MKNLLNEKNNRVWIAWERQRRSVELAKILHCELYIVEFNGFLRYPKSILKTISILSEMDCKIIFVQNPSMVLATLACLYKFFFRKKIIIDRHTTFRLDREKCYSLVHFVFLFLNYITIRFADITIVTNKYLAEIVKNMKGNPFVLPDKLPDMEITEMVSLNMGLNIVLISSFGEDEPIESAISAMNFLKNYDVTLYVTGNYKKLDEKVYNNSPSNVVFTGFLDDKDFVNILHAADAVMVLTTANHCMLCGCYEGVAACKPIITSDKLVLREYFKGSVFVENTDIGISEGIVKMISSIDEYKKNTIQLKKSIMDSWWGDFSRLENIIGGNYVK